MTPLMLAIFFLGAPATAQTFSLEAMLDDTGAPNTPNSAPAALRPNTTTIDHVYRTITIAWPDKSPETLPFGAILQIEHARAWDGRPEELFIALQDGRRVLLSQGDHVTRQAELMRAWLANIMVELPVGEGHTEPKASGPTPQLILNAAGADLSVGRLSGTMEKRTPESNPENTAKREGSCVNCIDKRDVDRIVKMRMDKIRGCYQRALQRDSSLSGEIVVRFEVGTDGTIGSASIKRSSIANSGVESCVREQFLQMRFPRPAGNQSVQVTYPIVFSSGR